MERWFGGFKHEQGPMNRFKDLTQLYEGTALKVYCYNTKRIHTALKMSPAAYVSRLKATVKGWKGLDKVFGEVRG